MDESTTAALNIRLSTIEEQLKDLKKLMIDSAIQQKDMQTMEQRVSHLESNEQEIFHRLNQLEIRPEQDSARRWNYVVDYIFKAIVSFGVVLLLCKVGLQ